MVNKLSDWWWRLPGIYPLYILTVLFLLSIIYEQRDLFGILFVLTGMQFLFWLFQISINYARKSEAEEIEPEDDPAGNTNIKRKFYDNM